MSGKSTRLAIDFANDNFRNNNDIVLAAVTQNGRILMHVSDYLKAVENSSTYLRIGSSIFGQRS